MPISDADLWHQVHAQREDGVAAMFLIRDVEPRADQPQLFVIELPYPITDLSKLPDAAGYRRLDTFQEDWVEPACEALGWTFVAWKSEDGSFFLYLYGDGDPNALLERLTAFDDALGYFNDRDADWSEYAALRELVEQAQAAPQDDADAEADHVHTADCDHGDDPDATPTIPVIDLTGLTDEGERAAPARTTRAETSRPAKARPAMARPAMAKATRTSAARSARPAAKPPQATRSPTPSKKPPSTKPARPSKQPPSTKPARPLKQPASTKPARPSKQPPSTKPPRPSKQPPSTKPPRPSKQPPSTKPARPSKKSTATRPAAARRSAKRPTAARPAAARRAKPQTPRR
jgi:hypothetical protein